MTVPIFHVSKRLYQFSIKTHLCDDLDGIYVLLEQRFPGAQLHAVRHRVWERVPVQVGCRHVITDQIYISFLNRTFSR